MPQFPPSYSLGPGPTAEISRVQEVPLDSECGAIWHPGSRQAGVLRVRQNQGKLDMREGMIKEFLSPPASPDCCIFAQTTRTLSADFTTRVEPCQFGGDPDCSRWGCVGLDGTRDRRTSEAYGSYYRRTHLLDLIRNRPLRSPSRKNLVETREPQACQIEGTVFCRCRLFGKSEERRLFGKAKRKNHRHVQWAFRA